MISGTNATVAVYSEIWMDTFVLPKSIRKYFHYMYKNPNALAWF